MSNPWKLRNTKAIQSLLTGTPTSVTVEGGTEGSDESQSSAISASGAVSSLQAHTMGTALDALSAMFAGYVGNDRKLLDDGFEDLVGILEEWRDAIPKVQ